MLKNKVIKLFLILGVIFFSFVVIGCSNEKVTSDVNFDINNEKYKYLFEEGDNSVLIISNIDELSKQNLSTVSDLTKYDETYFLNNYLLIFKFNMHYSESNLKVENTKTINNMLLINISIDSPANYENNTFDSQISTELLFVDVLKDSLTETKNLNVGILVINTRFKDVYCSVYYNCKRADKKY